MKRVYEELLTEHFNKYRQMVFLSGPHQVGKTTLAKMVDDTHLDASWDTPEFSREIIAGPGAFHRHCFPGNLGEERALLIIDELHKYRKWKAFLKGYFDTYGDGRRILVTGSARLDIYKKSGDSLMGRYFPYRLHPLSYGELVRTQVPASLLSSPQSAPAGTLEHLLEFGGFPEPFLKGEKRFYNRWRRLRTEQLFYQDLREASSVADLRTMEHLAELLRGQVGQQVNYSSLAKQLTIAVDTVRRWIAILESYYSIFTLRPWFSNVPKSLRKQPKVFMWDWSQVADHGAKVENLMASHLLKATHYWTDAGFGDFGLYYLRDKTKREVDFLVTRDGAPWFLVEVKTGTSRRLSPHLLHFHKLLGTKFAFQAEFGAPYLDLDCFTAQAPVKVPFETLISQLV